MNVDSIESDYSTTSDSLAESMSQLSNVLTVPAGNQVSSGGFDPSDLMAKPAIRQAETRNQANMVSAPYEEANRKAAEKTNPMNAESQDPGKEFLMKYIGK